MENRYIEKIAEEQNITFQQVKAVIELFEDGASIPFIARYRKEKTGSLDEVVIADIRDRLQMLEEIDKRRKTILDSIESQGKLTPELKKQIQDAEILSKLEDLYLPYKPKRRTKGMIAIENGLEQLAEMIFKYACEDINEEAAKYLNDNVTTIEDAKEGAGFIISEWINEDAKLRERLRGLFEDKSLVESKVISGKEEEGIKFQDYYEYSEELSTIKSHRLLALRRGEKEGYLRLKIRPDQEEAISIINYYLRLQNNECGELIKNAAEDAYKRLLAPSLETEIRLKSKEVADFEAISVFVENARELLLAPPLGNKGVLAIDPGFKTGCKVVYLDRLGDLKHNFTIYPFTGRQSRSDAEVKIIDTCNLFNVEAIAIGNGTASRETEKFIRGLNLPRRIPVVIVNESGASIYSASEIAREEFPDYDITVRGAVSIGRRLMDPLAELVKIDPKSIGVGQYQHDVDQKKLRQSLEDVVISCVNKVGVEINTASPHLLSYVSGLSFKVASNIVNHRHENGPFLNRKSFKAVAGIGDKIFEQCAGFLRIRESRNPLDKSAVHPESYCIVEKMAEDLNASVNEIIQKKELRQQISLDKYITEEVGIPTLEDILNELEKPGLDPRESFEVFEFREGVEKIDDLEIGMILPGIVTNVTAFGAFVDVGVHQDGLVHISQLANRFVKDPAEIVKVNQKVTVKVLQVDKDRKRIGFTMKI